MLQLGPISEGKRASVCKPRLLALAGQQKSQESLLPGNKRQITKKTGNVIEEQQKRQKALQGNTKGRQLYCQATKKKPKHCCRPTLPGNKKGRNIIARQQRRQEI